MIWVELISGEPPWSGRAITGFVSFPGDRPIFLEVFEIARVLGRFDHITSITLNANNGIV